MDSSAQGEQLARRARSATDCAFARLRCWPCLLVASSRCTRTRASFDSARPSGPWEVRPDGVCWRILYRCRGLFRRGARRLARCTWYCPHDTCRPRAGDLAHPLRQRSWIACQLGCVGVAFLPRGFVLPASLVQFLTSSHFGSLFCRDRTWRLVMP